jgi:hypothetical protein
MKKNGKKKCKNHDKRSTLSFNMEKKEPFYYAYNKYFMDVAR